MKKKDQSENARLLDWHTAEVLALRERKDVDKQAIETVGEAGVKRSQNELVVAGEVAVSKAVKLKFYGEGKQEDVDKAEKERAQKQIENEAAKRYLAELKEKSRLSDIDYLKEKNQEKERCAQAYREAVADGIERIQESEIIAEVNRVITACHHEEVAKLFPDNYNANLKKFSKAKIKELFPIPAYAGLTASLYLTLHATAGRSFETRMERYSEELERLSRKPKDWRKKTLEELNSTLKADEEHLRTRAEELLCVDPASLAYAEKKAKHQFVCKECGATFKKQEKYSAHLHNIHELPRMQAKGFRPMEEAVAQMEAQARAGEKRRPWVDIR